MIHRNCPDYVALGFQLWPQQLNEDEAGERGLLQRLKIDSTTDLPNKLYS